MNDESSHDKAGAAQVPLAAAIASMGDALFESEAREATNGVFLWSWDSHTDGLSLRRLTVRETFQVEGWRERIHTSDRVRVFWQMHQALRDGKEHLSEFRTRLADGREQRWLARGRARGAGRVSGSAVDISGMQRAEAFDQAEGLASVLDQTPAVFFIKDRDGRYVFANRRHLEIFKSERSKVLGKTAFDLFPSSVAEILHRNDERVWQGQTLHVEETVIDDGRPRTFLCVKFPLSSYGGTIDRLCCIATDITDRKHAEQALNHELLKLGRSNDELLQFAIAASHDLKEPLRLVATSLRQVERAGAPEEAALWTERARRGAEQMGTLIDELLIYARAGSNVARFAEVDCERAVQNVVQWLRVPIEEAQAVIQISALPVIWGDEVLVGQLFQNLIANAIKFRRDKPTIEISAVRSGAFWRFSVRDNGIGVDPRYLSEIFEPFRRLHTRQEYPGSGIGLAICRKVVERHGGEIGLDSTPGIGSTFYFTLPAIPT